MSSRQFFSLQNFCHLFNKKNYIKRFLFLFVLVLCASIASIILLRRPPEPSAYPAFFKLLTPDDKNFPDSDTKVYANGESLCLKVTKIVDHQNRTNICYQDNSGKTIHFVQLTAWTDLDACAVITAAVHNPNYGVCVLQTEKILLTDAIAKKFARFSNIQVSILDNEKLFEGTALFDWYTKACSSIKEYKYFVAQLADCVRWAYLFKYGGVSLDTDAFTLKSYENLTNTVALQNEGIINNAVLVFDKGNDYLAEIINTLPRYARADKWGTTSYWLMTDVYKERQTRFKITGDKESWVDVAPRSLFYPFYWGAGPESSPFSASSYDQAVRDSRRSYTIHLFRGKFTSYWTGSKKVEEESFVGKLIKRFCTF